MTSNAGVVDDCEFIDNVSSRSGWDGRVTRGIARENNEKTLRNKTAKIGGNVVFIQDLNGGYSSGEAYRCD